MKLIRTSLVHLAWIEQYQGIQKVQYYFLLKGDIEHLVLNFLRFMFK